MRHVIVTGGANGIGKALVEEFAYAGSEQITIIDRDDVAARNLLEKLHTDSRKINFIKADFADVNCVCALAEALARLPKVDIFINNAGINHAKPFFLGCERADNEIINVNFLTPVMLCQPLIAANLLSEGATLVFVSSLSVFSSYPGAAVYAGSKDGLHAFANSIRGLLKKKRMKVLVVYPGPTDTQQARSNSPMGTQNSRRASPKDVAKQIVSVVKHGQKWLVPGFSNKCICWLGRIFPSIMQTMMRKVIFERMDG